MKTDMGMMNKSRSGEMNMNNMPNMEGMNMGMAFEFSQSATILFKDWDIDSTGGMVWSCIVVFLMAIFYEGFKVFREVLREKYGKPKSYNVSSNGHGAAGKGPYDTSVYGGGNRFCNWHHFLQSFLHIIQVAISYFLMLIAMTFNAWLFIAVCLGAGFGYFLFSWRISKSYDVNEHCH
ncbi:high affinity copper uptake protein 1-like isoform X2 [Dendronephthya gigantea]|uniref:high affinity copper uptake protein 1-like isoform X2 n=1 Tax=Dendronephthya gigantea TaxID=151771 RepID=UPI00106B2BAB|nr:high affinity copper uptake protein 1-like isoform X2 [Dendronephthya gigantea]